MTYLRNSWYCAGLSTDIDQKPIGRTILDEYIVIYRGQGDGPFALSGRCPHRFAPMDQGVVVGDTIACPYHGLTFGSDGSCVFNPHGGPLPPHARMRTYPLVERNNILWIWMGDIEKADPSNLPDDGWLIDPGFSVRHTYSNIAANYQLLIDNLLDLTHTQYLHSNTLARPVDPEYPLRHNHYTEGSRIRSEYAMDRAIKSNLMRNIFPDAYGRHSSIMRWQPASILNLDLRMFSLVDGSGIDVHMPNIHYITPETETTTHYWSAIGRDVNIDNQDEDERIIGILNQAFRDEDAPMMEACQKLMGTTDMLSLRPVVLHTDAPAMQARRMLGKLIRDEHRAIDTSPEV